MKRIAKTVFNQVSEGTVITLHGFKFERFVVGASGSLRKGQDNGAMVKLSYR